MSPSEMVEAALERGASGGLEVLRPFEWNIWLISKAEILSDMDGNGSFLNRYGELLLETSEEFEAVGAIQIAQILRAIHASRPDPLEELLVQANSLLTRREGYDYDALLRYASQYT